MLSESFIAATLASSKPPQHLSNALKDVGIFQHEFQPQSTLRHGFKKSSIAPRCLAISDTHIYAAQSKKQIVHVYNRSTGQQEATVPFPHQIQSIAFAETSNVLIVGTGSGKLLLWEVATGRVSSSSASHLQGISHLSVTLGNDFILSGSEDATALVWSLSRLISFGQQSDPYSSETPFNSPIGAFSQHRSPITALTCGRSMPSTNFAVTASEDQTCHVWHIESRRILRTILLASIPTCVVFDPADRALYFGDNVGNVVFLDLLAANVRSENLASSSNASVPTQLTDNDCWKASLQPGPANCVTLSYDGLTVLTGHENGVVISWDAAKHRAISEVANLGQSVTNLQMLRPLGFSSTKPQTQTQQTVVKPRLDLDGATDVGSLALPGNYVLHTSLSGVASSRAGPEDNDLLSLREQGWPSSVLDDAVRSLQTAKLDSQIPQTHGESDQDKILRLEKEVDGLELRLASIRKQHQQRLERKAIRMEKRASLGEGRRQAYREARSRNEDGNAAIKVWEEAEDKLDEDSADDLLNEPVP